MARTDKLADKLAGVHYTPAGLAQRVLHETLGAWLDAHDAAQLPRVRVLDPACGDGAFLVAAYRMLLQRAGEPSPETRMRLLSCVHGVDVDATAVERARARLLQAAGVQAQLLDLRVGDALLGDRNALFGDAPFDVVVGNPPYVDSETLTAERPELRRRICERYTVARGNWDLFCPFVELSMSLLRDGGIHGFVVPNRLASAPYASATRALLAQQRLRWIGDYSSVRAFAAATYPLAYAVEKVPADDESIVRCEQMAQGGHGPVVAEDGRLPLSAFRGAGGWPLGDTAAHALGRRMQARWPALGDHAQVLGAATVAEAYALKPLLQDDPAPTPDDLRVLNSGTIDPFAPLWGRKPMRYLGQGYAHPVVRAADCGALPARRLQQARSPKVIVAGMTRRLECVADTRGAWLAAKSTSIVLPDDGRDVEYLTAVLNSELLTRLLRAMFPGLAMSGGYLRVGPPQLRRLPVRPVRWSDPSEALHAERIVQLARDGRRDALELAVRGWHGELGADPWAGP